MDWSSVFDLHSHTNHSDGEHSPMDVAMFMHNAGVKYWSLTDHDTIDGWQHARDAAQQLGLTFIPGIEITCDVGLPADEEEMERHGKDRASTSWHLLSYFPPSILQDQKRLTELHDWLLPLQTGRLPRMVSMIKKLEELQIHIKLEDVTRRAKGSLGRPHLAQAMVDAGYVESSREAFDKYIGDGGIAFVQREEPPLSKAIEFIHDCGGIVSLAHPLYYGVSVPKLMEYLHGLGCDAVEVFHRSHDDAYRFELFTEAKKWGLSVTVGSDFHGLSFGQQPGKMVVTKDFMPQLFLDL